MTSAFLGPGAWIGVIGGGQLGRMIAMDARRMGYRVVVFDPDPGCPAGQVADRLIARPFSDAQARAEFVETVSVITYEFENVDAAAVREMQQRVPVHPSPDLLWLKQSRVREKQALSKAGFPLARFRAVDSAAQVQEAIAEFGLPVVFKTASMGYDGKGQWVVSSESDTAALLADAEALHQGLVAEEFIPFAAELSVVCARNMEGETVCFPPSENVHQQGILDLSIVPARFSSAIADEAKRIAVGVAEALNVVGLVAVEMFLTKDGRLLINEIAPRPHNSGHYTIEACATSQFEQLVRILCGLPLGSVELLTPVVMANLLGDVWQTPSGVPYFQAALAQPGVRLHLYGKSDARPGRKMGHLTVVASSVDAALDRAIAARSALTQQPSDTTGAR